MERDIICWWSGGVTSAVACKIAIDIYGIERCRMIMIDTFNEHEDTYRFKEDCEKWYGKEIECITAITRDQYPTDGYTFIDLGHVYTCIEDVWDKNLSLNVATGAICSTVLKRYVRQHWQRVNSYQN